MSYTLPPEGLSRLKKGYKPVIVKRQGLRCPYGCLGTFRTEWDRQQHAIYAHENERSSTALGSFNEALGRGSPSSGFASLASPTKPPGNWGFVPRPGSTNRNYDQKSVKSGNDEKVSSWSASNIVRLFGVAKKKLLPAPSAPTIRIQDISNPIPHPRSLETAERLGTDLITARRHHQQISVYSDSDILSPLSEGSSGRDSNNPITLEAKDFESSTESDYSPPSSPFPGSSPSDKPTALPAEDISKRLPRLSGSMQSPSILLSSLPPSPRSPSFSRPTPAAYPMLQKLGSDSTLSFQSNSTHKLNPPPFSNRASLSPRPPPIPARNPNRPRRDTASDDGHGSSMSYFQITPAQVRRANSHSGLRL